MKRLLMAPLLVLLTGSLLVLNPTAAHACSCASESVAAHLSGADVVVRGTIQSRDELGNPLRLIRSSGDEVVYRVAVDEVFKGVSGPVAQIHSVASGASCGIEVEVGEEYLVFADMRQSRGTSGGELWAKLCGGTRHVSDLGDRAGVLASGAPPDRSVPVPDEASTVPTYLAAGVAAGVGVGVALIVVVRRRSGSRST
jgi:hypothetical protein